MLPVSYAGIHLKGNEEKFTFARTAELELKQLDCDMEEGNIEYPSCQIHEFPPHFKKALDDNDVRGAISYCEFSKTTLQVAQSLPEGGVLVQDLAIEALQIAAGGIVITQPPPLIIYSPRDVHVKYGDEEYVYAPSDSVTEQKILQSMLTTEDFNKLIEQKKPVVPQKHKDQTKNSVDGSNLQQILSSSQNSTQRGTTTETSENNDDQKKTPIKMKITTPMEKSESQLGSAAKEPFLPYQILGLATLLGFGVALRNLIKKNCSGLCLKRI
jgi:hypothetical protein